MVDSINVYQAFGKQECRFMKGVVAFDSVHGSTRQVAEAMVSEIKAQGHEAELVFVKETRGSPTGDFLFIGSPTRGGGMTRETKKFIDGLDAAYWKSRPVVAFDTVGPLSKDAEKRRVWLQRIDDGTKNAAARIREACEGRGITVSKLLHYAVVGMWGPLAPDAPEAAREHTRKFLAQLR